MPISERFEVHDGRLWAVTSSYGVAHAGRLFVDHYGPAVIVPIDELEGMSNKQIGKAVRELIPLAQLARMAEQASYIRSHISRYTSDDQLVEWLEDLTPYQDQAEVVDLAIGELRELLEQREKAAKTMAAKGRLMKQRRVQFANNRADLALALIERDGYECAICGAQDDLSIDHIYPLSKGGSDILDNLRFLCRSCNSKKGDAI